MTIFGWDASHYDGPLTEARVRRAMAEGIAFATHKLGEGGTYADPLAGANLNAMHAAGLRAIGAYYVPRTPGRTTGQQVDHCVALADDLIPWWRTFPGFFWQDDVELWDYDRVSMADGKAFGRLLAARSGKAVALYASTGMYGAGPAAWPGIWWNANYGRNPAGPFRDVYPGDRSSRWAANAGRAPDILQYGSKTTVAGLTTCDANAFRGTLDELLTLINPTPPGGDMAAPTPAQIEHAIWHTPGSTGGEESAGTALGDARDAAVAASAGVVDIKSDVAGIATALRDLQVGGTAVDLDALAAKIAARVDLDALAAKVDALIAARYAN